MTNTLTGRQVDALIDAFYDADLDTADLRLDYSGRGMFGRRCVGYTGDNPIRAAFELATVIAAEGDGEPTIDDVRGALENLGTPCSDAMGLGTIWYWPSVAADEQHCRAHT